MLLTSLSLFFLLQRRRRKKRRKRSLKNPKTTWDSDSSTNLSPRDQNKVYYKMIFASLFISNAVYNVEQYEWLETLLYDHTQITAVFLIKRCQPWIRLFNVYWSFENGCTLISHTWRHLWMLHHVYENIGMLFVIRGQFS